MRSVKHSLQLTSRQVCLRVKPHDHTPEDADGVASFRERLDNANRLWVSLQFNATIDGARIRQNADKVRVA